MRIKVLKSTGKYWYSKNNENMIGQIRKVKFSRPRNAKFYKNPIKWIIAAMRLEDKELSSKAFGKLYDRKDIKVISLF